MPLVQLTGGAYLSRSASIAVQASVNLLTEAVPRDSGEPVSAAQVLTPGCRLLGLYGNGSWRGLYRSTTGTVYGVVGSELCSVGNDLSVTALGTLPSLVGPVSMSDNGQDLVVVDGSPRGFHVTMATGAFAEILDPAFYGADRVACLDGFFVFNRPGTNQFYLSNAVATTFNPLYIAAKASLDRLVSLAVVNRELWLLGETRTEIYSNTGAADFPFASMSGGIEQGCVAKSSLAAADGSLFWLGRTRDGAGIVLQGRQYQAQRVSTHSIEHAIQGYPMASDAVGWTYQLDGHTVYALCFPTADVTWAYDLATKEWHQWSSSADASLHRHRGNCAARAIGTNLVGDWQNGYLYALETATLTDNGQPIQRVRAFPHVEDRDGNRLVHHRLLVDMQCGTVPAGQSSANAGGVSQEPQLTLTWSDDQGQSWSAPVTKGMGLSGLGQTSLQFRRLGMARSRIYQVSWNAPVQTALLGAYLDASPAGT